MRVWSRKAAVLLLGFPQPLIALMQGDGSGVGRGYLDQIFHNSTLINYTDDCFAAYFYRCFSSFIHLWSLMTLPKNRLPPLLWRLLPDAFWVSASFTLIDPTIWSHPLSYCQEMYQHKFLTDILPPGHTMVSWLFLLDFFTIIALWLCERIEVRVCAGYAIS